MTSVFSVRSAAVALAAGSALILSGCTDAPASSDDASTIVRSTTVVAGAGVVGNNRETVGLCPETAPVDPTGVEGSVRPVGHAEGISDVPADPMRIVVLDPASLDAACSVGLWERVVGASTIDPDFRGDGDQELYLGTGIAEIPSVGAVGSPDIDMIKALSPDLIIGADALGPGTYDALSDIAATVFTTSDKGWKDTFLQSAAALGRGDTAFGELARFSADAERVGRDANATQTQASAVRFLPDSIVTDGPRTFASEVLTEIGVQRPPSQRSESVTLSSDDVSAAEGDIVYVRFDGDAGQTYGTSVMTGTHWEDLGAVKDGRVFAVNDTVWSGSGIVAARAILADVTNSLNAYVS
ncbi:ABC transporter substrate-binding protein [Rhodococcus sp. G-MC3]|uniref:ABC transporter substrate-binding protein n=1 Tax=Rhodococcus sp. G-MC3 TaxID=3046209 RepID=UPI0024B87BED|nr:ABC transporter substrate-binding protein [Rhodococcus sp. G-MC3]MDJ0392023.1 ABC transporter substrate-binding protein [Rhodococcus sp. G-MC3]